MSRPPHDLDALIEALTILRKYGNPLSPTRCRHDTLLVSINPDKVSADDIVRLAQLWFFAGGESERCFLSFQFGFNTAGVTP